MKYILLFITLICAVCAEARELLGLLPEQTASVYYAYPEAAVQIVATPADFEPVYLSHYGRHGSRWMPDSTRYLVLLRHLERLDSANALTPLGKDVLRRVQMVWQDAKGNEGLLSPLGHRQHAAIARRMMRRMPGFFRPGDSIVARSSTVKRCRQSMGAFLEALADTLPHLKISSEASEATMAVIVPPKGEAAAFLDDKAPWIADLWRQAAQRMDPQRLYNSLSMLPDTTFVPFVIGSELFWYASDMQDVEPDISFYDLFLPEELEETWRAQNSKMYISCGRSPRNGGLPQTTAVATLRDIIQRADSALEHANVRADLRFGHDTNLLRLLSLMGVEQASAVVHDLDSIPSVWRDYQLSPMAANLQMLFYRTPEHTIFVRLLLNEKDVTLPIPSLIAPFYPWEEVKKYWLSQTLTDSQRLSLTFTDPQ